MTHKGTTFTAAPRDDTPKGSVAANVRFTLPDGLHFGFQFAMAANDDAQCHDRPNAAARTILEVYNKRTGYGLDVQERYPEIAGKIRNLLLPNAR